MLPPLDDECWPAGLTRLRQDFAGRLNVYRVMAHHPALLAAWETLRNHVVLHSALSPQQRELVILRVGRHWQSHYEWGQHVVRGRQAGLSDARIRAVRHEPALLADETERLLLDCTDDLLKHAMMPRERAAAMLRDMGEAATLDLVVTVGMYTTLAGIVNSFAVELEPEIVSALLLHPLDGAAGEVSHSAS